MKHPEKHSDTICSPAKLMPRVRLRGRRSPAKGLVLAIVLTFIAVAALLILGVTQRIVRHHRQIRGQTFAAQARLLVESGAERAALRCRDANDYEGEVWKIPAEQMQTRHAARVEIKIIDRPAPQTVVVRVRVQYPSDLATGVQLTREFLVDIRADNPTTTNELRQPTNAEIRTDINSDIHIEATSERTPPVVTEHVTA